MLKNCCSEGKCTTGKAICGIVFGTVVGIIMGLIFAPKSGKETRKQIASKAETMCEDINYKTHELKGKVAVKTEKVQEDLNELKEELKEKVLETAEKVQEEIIVKADEIKEKVKEKVSLIKAYKEEASNTEFFEDVTMDFDSVYEDDKNLNTQETNSENTNSQEDNKNSTIEAQDIGSEQLGLNQTEAEVVVKPKRTRKKAKIVEETDSNPENKV